MGIHWEAAWWKLANEHQSPSCSKQQVEHMTCCTTHSYDRISVYVDTANTVANTSFWPCTYCPVWPCKMGLGSLDLYL